MRKAWGAAALLGVVAARAADSPDASLQVSFGVKKPGPVYVGDAECATCHQDKVATYHQTAHARTSSLPSAETIHGNFNPGANVLRTVNPNLFFVMEAKGKTFTENAVFRRSATEVLTRTEQIDVVVGSGRKGQTYLFWDGDELHQLPVSYWTSLGDWVNSPGYVDGNADFERPIPRRCLECHASRFESRAPPEDRYDKTSLVLAIECEKCHGPGSEHVARYRSASPPKSAADAAIVNPARLPRGRQIDVCALCHAGPGNSLTPPLSFRPGGVLAEHLVFPKMEPGAHIDVHASQVQLLERSRCYLASTTMTCTTCHDVHRPERDLQALASRCLTCHQVESCRLFPRRGRMIAGQCIVCHMPLEKTDQIIIATGSGASLQPRVRSHLIAIYPETDLP